MVDLQTDRQTKPCRLWPVRGSTHEIAAYSGLTLLDSQTSIELLASDRGTISVSPLQLSVARLASTDTVIMSVSSQ